MKSSPLFKDFLSVTSLIGYIYVEIRDYSLFGDFAPIRTQFSQRSTRRKSHLFTVLGPMEFGIAEVGVASQ